MSQVFDENTVIPQQQQHGGQLRGGKAGLTKRQPLGELRTKNAALRSFKNNETVKIVKNVDSSKVISGKEAGNKMLKNDEALKITVKNDEINKVIKKGEPLKVNNINNNKKDDEPLKSLLVKKDDENVKKVIEKKEEPLKVKVDDKENENEVVFKSDMNVEEKNVVNEKKELIEVNEIKMIETKAIEIKAIATQVIETQVVEKKVIEAKNEARKIADIELEASISKMESEIIALMEDDEPAKDDGDITLYDAIEGKNECKAVKYLNDENQENIPPADDNASFDHSMEDITVMSTISTWPSFSHTYSGSLIVECPEYSDSIHEYLLKYQLKHKPDPYYMEKQKDISPKMRSILYDWMVDVTEEYDLTPETLFIACNCIDLFLSNMSVTRRNYQLLGVAALFSASKYEEIYPPEIDEFVNITDKTYTKYEIFQMERMMLEILDFRMSRPTPIYFLRAYINEMNLPKAVKTMAEFYCFLSIMEVAPFLQTKPSDIAISSIILAACTCGFSLLDDPQIASMFRSVDDEEICAHLKTLQPCVNALLGLHKLGDDYPYQAIFNKYSMEKHLCISQVKPLDKAPNLSL